MVCAHAYMFVHVHRLLQKTSQAPLARRTGALLRQACYALCRCTLKASVQVCFQGMLCAGALSRHALHRCTLKARFVQVHS